MIATSTDSDASVTINGLSSACESDGPNTNSDVGRADDRVDDGQQDAEPQVA